MQSICSWLKVMLLAASPFEDDELDLDEEEEEVVECRKSDRCGWVS